MKKNYSRCRRQVRPWRTPEPPGHMASFCILIQASRRRSPNVFSLYATACISFSSRSLHLPQYNPPPRPHNFTISLCYFSLSFPFLLLHVRRVLFFLLASASINSIFQTNFLLNAVYIIYFNFSLPPFHSN